MNNYLLHQYRETRLKFDKFSSRLQKSQENGEFQKMARSKQNFLLTRLKRVWEKLRLLEVKLKISSAGAALACMLMVSNLGAQDQFVAAHDKNPLSPPTIFALSPMLVDIDNDGDLDILGSEKYVSLDLFMNLGTSEAPVFERVADENSPFSGIDENLEIMMYDIKDAGDIDGDGDIDFITDEGYILRNKGTNDNPEFEAEDFDTYIDYRSSLGDIDGDGDLDLIQSIYSNSIYVKQNIGDASNFEIYTDTAVKFEIHNWEEEISWINNCYPLDLDGDGDLDLLADVDFQDDQGDAGEGFRIIRNTGSAANPVFTLEDNSNNPYRDLNTYDPAFGDLDGDGDLDVIYCDYYNGLGIRYFEAEENTLTENRDFIPEFTDGTLLPITPYPIQFADYDGDGDLDLFTWKYYSEYGTLGYYECLGDGEKMKYVEQPDISFSFFDEEAEYQHPVFADLDLDGDQDVLMIKSVYNGDWIWTYEFLENTGSDASPVYAAEAIPVFPELEEHFIPSFVDIDNDGDLDIFFLGEERLEGYSRQTVTKFYESTGEDPLGFTERTGDDNPLLMLNETTFEDLHEYARPVFSDIDGDGDYDVVASGYYGLYHLENVGTAAEPAFEDKTSEGPLSFINETFHFYPSANFVDLDGDGDDDLFLHELYGLLTTYYENTLGTGKSIHEVPDIKSLSIFPNPASNEIGVRLNSSNLSDIQYEVISIEGRILIKGETVPGISTETLVIHTSELSSGYYILKVNSAQGLFMSKFVIK